ncbi:hypothetical protein [Moraxella lacunata]|uniref:hypothetical protein n=1 Tax=Moraxella lacunata TaxID=477 RepID=UPI003EE1F19C
MGIYIKAGAGFIKNPATGQGRINLLALNHQNKKLTPSKMSSTHWSIKKVWCFFKNATRGEPCSLSSILWTVSVSSSCLAGCLLSFMGATDFSLTKSLGFILMTMSNLRGTDVCFLLNLL